MAKLANAKGEMVYYNLVEKNGKLQWVIKGIGDTVVLGRDRQKKKSRSFTQAAQATAHLKLFSFAPCSRSTPPALSGAFSVGKKTATAGRGCNFTLPAPKCPQRPSCGRTGAKGKRPPRVWVSVHARGPLFRFFGRSPG